MDNDPLTNIDYLLNSIDDPYANTQNINNINIDSQMNIDDILKETEGYDNIDSGISKLDFLNSTEKNLKELQNEEASIKKENLINEILAEVPKSNKVIKKKIEIPKFKNSIEFINYMETYYIESTMKKNKSIFKLSNFSENMKKKPTILQFPNKEKLTKKIYRESTPIYSITAKKNRIFTGDSMGKIKMFECENECEIKAFINKEIENTKVLCMDISDDDTTLLAGYSNGYLILWDIKFCKIKKSLKKEHKNGILCAKFLLSDISVTEFISSDLDGEVNKIILTQNFLYLNVKNENIIYYKKTPFYQIDILQLHNDELKYECFNNKNPEIVSLASTEFVIIYQLVPKIIQLYKIHRPLYFSKPFIPDISFGYGYIPINVPSKILNSLKENEKIEENLIAKSNNIDINKLQRLFAISWEKVVYIYVFRINQNTGFKDIILVGHYVNSNQILRMGFLSNSILFIYDMYKSLKVLNTGLLTPGDIYITKDFIVMPQINKKKKSELNDIKMDEQFLFQSFIKDLSEKKREILLPTYNNFIINQNKTLFILTKKNFLFGKILNWEQSINDLRERGEWMEALSLGVDIYLGKNNTFSDIPIVENERKIKVGSSLKAMILQYCTINTDSNDINNCLDICIELCILIDDVDYLINIVKPIFDNRHFTDAFFQKLEPFILNDNMKDQKISYKTLMIIIDFYKKKNNIETLGLILKHLNLTSFDSNEMLDLFVKFKLITPLIYVYMNNKEENYFEPILKIYDIFLNSKEIENEKFISYENALNDLPLLDIENSKQYIGDKLLWYINLCIDGNKYPTQQKISENKYNILIKDIFLWMIKKNILIILLNFDSLSVFSIISRLFKITNNFSSQYNIEFEDKKFEGIIYNNEQIKESNIYIFINVIIEIVESLNIFSIKLDLYNFMVKVAIQLNELDKNIIIKTVKFLISIESELNTYKNEKDIFGFRNKELSDDEIIKISKKINTMINHFKQLFNENDYKDLIKSTDNTSFILVKINLLKILNENLQCLDLFLYEYKFSDKIKKTYDFIDETLRKYKSQNQEQFMNFKNKCMEKLIDLCSLSSQNLFNLIFEWYDNNQNVVLEYLNSNKLLKLDYLEKVILSYKEDYLPIDDEGTEIYHNLLNLHIDLLIECNQKEKILENIKKRAYPSDCLEKFKKHKIDDACIYFYILENNLEDALNLSNQLLKTGMENLLINLKLIAQKNAQEKIVRATEDANKKKGKGGKISENLILKHEENLDRSINICQQDFTDDEIREKSWFKLIKMLYDFRKEVKQNQIESNELDILINKDIQKVFDNMYTYVKITKIMTTLTQQNKEIEYKEFKPILVKMVDGFTHSRKILELASNIFTINILKDEKELSTIIKIGTIYDMDKCDYCDNKIKDDDVVCFFKCGHKMHFMCSIKKDDFMACNVCRKKEIENSIASFDDDNNISKPSIKEMEECLNNNDNISDDLTRKYYNLNIVNKELLFDNAYILNFD